MVLTWWAGWQPVYALVNVNAMSRMLRAYLRLPFRLVLLTDQDAAGAEVDSVLPLPPCPLRQVKGMPNCYRRLRLFDPEYSAQFGSDWLLSIDLDALIRADITDLVAPALSGSAPFLILRSRWPNQKGRPPYNGSLWLLRQGALPEVWRTFDPVESVREILKRRLIGSDQAWLGLAAPGAATLGPEHGMYFFHQYLKHRKLADHVPARVVSCAGPYKPWSKGFRFQARDLWEEYRRWL